MKFNKDTKIGELLEVAPEKADFCFFTFCDRTVIMSLTEGRFGRSFSGNVKL